MVRAPSTGSFGGRLVVTAACPGISRSSLSIRQEFNRARHGSRGGGGLYVANPSIGLIVLE
jgi:hypothetical protein